jgi:phage terminase large subunit
MYCLGMYYNKALIGIEANYSTFPIQELERLKYPNQYVRVKEDKYTKKTEKSYGFKTTTVSRPRILGQLQAIIKESIELLVDIDTLKEGLTFIKNEKGRAEAQVGYHDDLIMALAIAFDIRTQQSMKKEIKEVEQIQRAIEVEFGFKREKRDDADSIISVF